MRIAIIAGAYRDKETDQLECSCSSEALLQFIDGHSSHQVSIICSWSDVREVPDVHLTRFFSYREELTAIAAYFESRGSKPINPSLSAALMNNKHTSHLLFARHSLPQLPWQIVSEDGVLGYPSWEGETVLKPVEGMAGQGVQVFATRREALEEAERYFMLQPFVPDARSWRIIVGKNSGVIASYYRLMEGEKISAVSLGAKRVYGEPGRRARELALAMNASVNGVLTGCDLLEKNDSFIALEINNSIGLDRENQDLMQGILDEISLVHQDRSL